MNPAIWLPLLHSRNRRFISGRYVPCIIPDEYDSEKVKQLLKDKKLWDGIHPLTYNYVPEKTWLEILNSSK